MPKTQEELDQSHLAQHYNPPMPSQTLLQIIGALPFMQGKARENLLHAIVEQMKDELGNAYSAGVDLGTESAFISLGRNVDGSHAVEESTAN